jgi:signal transduction histidine kinase
LHDTVSQDLVALSFSLNRRQAGSTDSDAGVNVDLVSRCCGDIRVIMSLLAPLVSGVEGIAGTIYQYAEQLKRDAGMTIIAHCGPGLGNVSYEIQSLMLSALQEWISRTALKREKTSLFINLQNSANGIVLELETVFGDNITEASLTQGWTAVRERAAALGGKLEIISESSRSLARILIPEST